MKLLILLLFTAAPMLGCRSEPEDHRTTGAAATPSDPRGRAAMHFVAGRYGEAEKIYRELIASKPDDREARVSLAGVLGALGKFDEADVEIEKVIAADPLNPAAYHNRAVLHERKGETEFAIEDYRRAVRYSPQYEPSRRALARLTGSPEASPLQSDAERQAAALAEEAAVDARAGNYDAAMEKLGEAERIAPELALVAHHRSNVAYLKGDPAAAIAALEKALVLEPGNALFAFNLRRLKEQKEPQPLPAAATPGS